MVFEEIGMNTRVRMVGAGLGAFVREDFIRELKTPPFFWIGPELARPYRVW